MEEVVYSEVYTVYQASERHNQQSTNPDKWSYFSKSQQLCLIYCKDRFILSYEFDKWDQQCSSHRAMSAGCQFCPLYHKVHVLDACSSTRTRIPGSSCQWQPEETNIPKITFLFYAPTTNKLFSYFAFRQILDKNVYIIWLCGVQKNIIKLKKYSQARKIINSNKCTSNNKSEREMV